MCSNSLLLQVFSSREPSQSLDKVSGRSYYPFEWNSLLASREVNDLRRGNIFHFKEGT